MKKTFIRFAPKIVSKRFSMTGNPGFTAYKEDGETETKEIKNAADLLKELGEMKADLEKKAAEDVDKAVAAKAQEFADKIKDVSDKISEVKGLDETVTIEDLKKMKEDLAVSVKAIDKLAIAVKNQKSQSSKPEVKTFNQVLSETIEDHAEEIKSFKKGNPEKKFEMKAVGDMSVAVNFPGAGTFTQDIRSGIIETPFNRLWLADVLPQGTSSGSSILYPKENGGEGAAALWTDKTTDKPQMDFDLTGQNAYFKWLAGIVIIEREMLDDIPFLNSYLTNKMLISLKIAENDFILNGSSDTNPVQGMLDVATAYDGTFTDDVDRIIDAGWGQIVEDTFDFYNPTHTILTPRDSVAIGLNKASGSGEYNLPAGSVAFAAGQLIVAGLTVVKTTQIGSGNFLTFDKNAVMFIKRMQPELRMFEDAALARRNKIMFRVEERATLAIFNNAALVKGTLAAGS
jgi:uncharacterized protein YaaR (DUF327 family)